MSQLEANNWLKYILAALAGAMLATGLLLGNVLSGTGAIEWRPLLAVFVSTFFGTLATTVGASFLPKNGHAELAALTDAAGHAAAKTALAETVAAQIAGVSSTPFTSAQVQQLVDALHEPVATDLEARMKTESAEMEHA